MIKQKHVIELYETRKVINIPNTRKSYEVEWHLELRTDGELIERHHLMNYNSFFEYFIASDSGQDAVASREVLLKIQKIVDKTKDFKLKRRVK